MLAYFGYATEGFVRDCVEKKVTTRMKIANADKLTVPKPIIEPAIKPFLFTTSTYNLPPAIHHPPSTYLLPLTTCHLPYITHLLYLLLTTGHAQAITRHLSSSTHSLSCAIYHPSPMAHHLSITYHIPVYH